MSLTSEPATHVKKINWVKTQGVEWDFELEHGSNTVTGAMSYGDDFEGWLARAPALQSAHPDIPALRLKKIKASREEGDKIKVGLAYECNDPEATYPGRDRGPQIRYSIEAGGGEEPLLTNKLFHDLTNAEKEAALQLVNSSKGPEDFTAAAGKITSVNGLKLIAKVRKGIDSYRAFGVVWVERFTTTRLDDVELTKIYTTVSQPPGDCPEAGADYNWLRLPPGVSPHEDGKTWDLENRWELSLFGKWDADLYPAG